MKKEVKKAATTTGSKKRINKLVRELVIEARKVKVADYQSVLMENILDEWDKFDNKEAKKTKSKKKEEKKEKLKKPEIELNSAEKEFASRLHKFLEHYKKALLVNDTEYWLTNYGMYDTSESYQKRVTSESALNTIITRYYNVLLSMFAVSNRQKPITLVNINNFRIHALSYHKEIDSCSIQSLFNFFYKKLYFMSETDLPVFVGDSGDSEHNLMTHKQFQAYMNGISKNYRRTETFETAMAAIWLINKYF